MIREPTYFIGTQFISPMDSFATVIVIQIDSERFFFKQF